MKALRSKHESYGLFAFGWVFLIPAVCLAADSAVRIDVVVDEYYELIVVDDIIEMRTVTADMIGSGAAESIYGTGSLQVKANAFAQVRTLQDVVLYLNGDDSSPDNIRISALVNWDGVLPPGGIRGSGGGYTWVIFPPGGPFDMTLMVFTEPRIWTTDTVAGYYWNTLTLEIGSGSN